jgi:hypothetical protein
LNAPLLLSGLEDEDFFLWKDKQRAPRRGGGNRKVERGLRRKGREM